MIFEATGDSARRENTVVASKEPRPSGSGHSPRVAISALVCVACLLTTAGCQSRSQESAKPAAITGRTMGTTHSIKIAKLPSSHTVEQIKTEIDRRLEVVNNLMSTYRPKSELSRFNRSKNTDWFPVSKDTATVIREAQRISQLSGGAFDVTVGPLVNLWSFGPDKRPKNTPSAVEIQQAKQRTGSDKIAVRDNPVALRKSQPDAEIDLSAIAKGFGVDKVAAYLDELNIAGYMVEIGGEIRCKGTRIDGSGWKIGIQSPGENQSTPYKVIELKTAAMATSGDYRNYFEQDGKRYSHTIDPRTGHPVEHGLASVTVIAETCMTADALATTIMVLGPNAGYDFALKHNLAVLLLIPKGDGFRERATPEFQQYFAKKK